MGCAYSSEASPFITGLGRHVNAVTKSHTLPDATLDVAAAIRKLMKRKGALDAKALQSYGFSLDKRSIQLSRHKSKASIIGRRTSLPEILKTHESFNYFDKAILDIVDDADRVCSNVVDERRNYRPSIPFVDM